jgi:hypothetical protein
MTLADRRLSVSDADSERGGDGEGDGQDADGRSADGQDTDGRSADGRGGRPCPLCETPMYSRHCKYVCPNHGVVYDCGDTFY